MFGVFGHLHELLGLAEVLDALGDGQHADGGAVQVVNVLLGERPAFAVLRHQADHVLRGSAGFLPLTLKRLPGEDGDCLGRFRGDLTLDGN